VKVHLNPLIENLGDEIYRIGPLGDPKILSSYLIKDGENYALVDCGPAVVIDQLLDLAGSIGVENSKITNLLLTHIHIDHAGGAAKLIEHCPNAIVFVPRRGFKHMLDPSVLNKSARAVLGNEIMDYWGESGAIPPERAKSVNENEFVSFGSRKLKYIPATGHAPHHNVLHEEKSSFVFAADSLGIVDPLTNAQTPTTPPPSVDLRQALLDIEMVRKLNAKMLCLAHYGAHSAQDNFFERTTKVYETWGKVVKQYLQTKNLNLEYSDFAAIFETLEEKFPEYRNVEHPLKHQVTRIDVAGLVEYFLRLNGPER
jgi:glyoxylase-like metal-dependent hydrolase (beta-lactamase superfamily II)